MSSDLQVASPKQQREQIVALARRSNWDIAQWYEDLAISGDDIQRRTAFRQMVGDASIGRFDRILCWSQDRFGRFDSIEAGEWIGPLRRAGVKLQTVTDGEINWHDAISRLIYLIQQEGRHGYLVDRSLAILRGAQYRAKHGLHLPGKTPYGYHKLLYDERGKLVRRLKPGQKLSKPREWTAKLAISDDRRVLRTVRYLFRSYARGMSLRAIVVSLNARRVPSPNGKYWSTDTVRKILSNGTYVGDLVWNKRHKGKYAGVVGGEIVGEQAHAQKYGPRKTFYVRNRREDWVVVQDVFPAIIERKTFDQVQLRLEENGPRKHERIVEPLKSICVCGHCGRPLNISHHRYVRSGKVAYYRRLECPSYHNNGPTVCRPRSISQPLLFRIVLTILSERVLDECVESRIRELSETDRDVADAMSRIARFRVALLGDDVEMLCITFHEIISRIVLWFGRHPRIRRASKMKKGEIHLNRPFTDGRNGGAIITFGREEFEQACAALPARMRNHNHPR